MKIDYVLVGSTKNPLYLDFWPLISKVWKKRFNVIPVLGLIDDNQEELVEDDYGLILKVKEIENYDSSLLSQLVRFYLPKYLNGNCIISDIDMFPVSKKYFLDDLNGFENTDFIIMSSNHPQTFNTNQYPMCYVLGSDKNFKKLFNLDDTWEEFIKKIPNTGWFTDQTHLFNCIKKNTDINFKFPKRENGFIINRIDRSNWSYDENKIKDNFYIDCHSLRPYSNYPYEIDKLINILIND